MKTMSNEIRKHNDGYLLERAKDSLIMQRKCATVKDSRYSVPCFGPDSNSLDYARRWLFDESINSGCDVEDARIKANKTVLYVNQNELDTEVHRLRAAQI